MPDDDDDRPAPDRVTFYDETYYLKRGETAPLDAWRDAVIDALVVDGIYRRQHDVDPRGAINELIAWNQRIALDPAVSQAAADLRDTYKATVEGLEAAVESWKKDEAIWKDTEAELLAKLQALEREKQALENGQLVLQDHADDREAELEHAVAQLKAEIGTLLFALNGPVIQIDAVEPNLSEFAAQIVTEPDRLCATCQHPAKNHTLGKCRKKRCGCGGWRG